MTNRATLTIWLICLSLVLTSSPLRGQCPSLVWSDEFSGNALDSTRWEAQLGNGCNIGLCGWGNNELQSYQAANAEVRDGRLIITARREQADARLYTSARLRTRGLGDWTYGHFESRIRLPEGQGAWPAFWMLSTDETYGPWPQSGEIDIMESRGLSPQVGLGTIHFGDPVPNNRSVGGSIISPQPLSEDFHVFSVEWQQNEIRWFLDGASFSRVTPQNLRGHRWPFDQAFHLLLNLAVGGTFPGPPDPADFPVTMEVDYVRVYDGPLPRIEGSYAVFPFSRSVRYTVVNSMNAANLNWEVPEGAQIAEGQGTKAILVNWGEAGGSVRVSFDSDCGPEQLEYPVWMKYPDVVQETVEDYQSESRLNLLFASGQYEAGVANPDASGANTSTAVARYRRNSGDKFDVLLFQTSAFPDVADYVAGRRRLQMDVFTDAPTGTEIVLQFEADGRTSATNFPVGRHSSYTTHTTRQNEWETLEFDLTARLDGGTADTQIDNLVILTDPGWNTGNTYYFDNLAQAIVDDSLPSTPSGLRLAGVTTTTAEIEWQAASDNLGVAGYLIELEGEPFAETDQTRFTLTGLEPGQTRRVSVRSRDLAGNLSPSSQVLDVMTLPANLIPDPGFESGGTGSWSGASATDTRAHSGRFSARLESEMVLELDSLKPNTTYRLSAWAAADPGSALRLGVRQPSGATFSVFSAATAFEQLELSFTTGEIVTGIRILIETRRVRGRGSWNLRRSAGGWIDDLELMSVVQ